MADKVTHREDNPCTLPPVYSQVMKKTTDPSGNAKILVHNASLVSLKLIQTGSG